MGLDVQITFDCGDADRLATFWALALDYQPAPPPGGFATWPEFLEANGIPVPPPGTMNAVVDPDGRGPRLLFQRVSEAKTVKNRVHLDVRAGDRWAVKVAELVAAGGTELRQVEESGQAWVVMADPEGNEFCVT
ncbi:MAG: VOC family protein [Acidimicrobiia bacterium]